MEDEAIEKERELFKLIASRRGKLGFLTRKRNEIKSFIDARESKQLVSEHMHAFNKYLEQFMELQVAVQSLLVDEDEREADHNDWYEPKLLHMKEFIEQTETWLKNIEVGGEEQRREDLNATVQPQDSVSQVGRDVERAHEEPSAVARKAPSRVSLASSGRSTAASKVSVAYVEAEVERATLVAKAQALQEKHEIGRAHV